VTFAFRTRATLAAACVTLGAVLAVACGPSTPSGPTASPGASPSPAASGAGSNGVALPTPWPANSVLGIEALGISDGNIRAATDDLGRGVANEDLALMRQAADGLAGVDSLLPNMAKIRLNPAFVPFADKYEAAIKTISASAKELRDAIDAGNAAAIGTSTQALLDGLKAYAEVQPELAGWIEQLPDQKRMLTQ
jgi:hypothetical protein